jgi:hypothetical protein
VPHPCQNTLALRVTGGHSGDMRRHSDLASGRYQSYLNKPDREEIVGRLGHGRSGSESHCSVLSVFAFK